MSTATAEDQQGQPPYSEVISQLLEVGLLERAEPPILRGKHWQRAKMRLPGCFPDMCEICPSHDRQHFSQLFKPVLEELVDLESRGLLCYATCLESICRDIPPPQDLEFNTSVAAAVKRNGISPKSVMVLRAIRLLTIAAETGHVKLR